MQIATQLILKKLFYNKCGIMNILAVNISKQVAKMQPFDATQEAWKLNEKKFRANLPEFVIGVAAGEIKGYYKLQNVIYDNNNERLKFTLVECNETEISLIYGFIKDKNLKYFVTKKKW